MALHVRFNSTQAVYITNVHMAFHRYGGSMSHSQSQTSLSSMDGLSISSKRTKRKERKEKKSDTGFINKTGGKRIITIGKPENVQ